MAVICRGHNLPYLMAAQSYLEEHGIPGMVQDRRNHLGVPDGWTLTVPNSEHDRALKLLDEADLDQRTKAPRDED